MTSLLKLDRELKQIGLIGRKATIYGSDDELILLSGGPKSHLAQFSILAGPTKKRVIIRQPSDSELDAEENYNPLMKDIKLHQRNVPVIGEIEEWKHGSWYHSNKIFCEDLPTLLEKLGDYSGDEIADSGDIGPQRSFWVTSLSYDLVQFTQPIKLQNKPKQGNLLGIFWLIENWIIEESNGLSAYGMDKDWVRKTTEVIENLEDVPNFESKNITSRITEIESSHDDKAHVQEIEKILESIRDGRLYQLNFGREWKGKMHGEPIEVFHRLSEQNPAPFSCFIYSPDLSFSLISSSPESLLISKNGKLKTSPIKGTRPRGNTEDMEITLRKELLNDPKERAEHRMLVDLMRNDLGISCKTGTIKVDRFDIETYSQVQHLVSHVSGQLDDTTTARALCNIFPGGSITGCPRTVVCAAIDKIEGKNRSFWTGSVGWYDPHANQGIGEGAWNILIRTIEAKKEGTNWIASITAGGGITIGSIPQNEVDESKWKATALKRACGWELDSKTESDLVSGDLEIYPVKSTQQTLTVKNQVGRIVELEDRNEVKNPLIFIDNLDSFSYNLIHYFASQDVDILTLKGRGEQSEALAKNLEKIIEETNPIAIVIGPGPGWPSESELTMQAARLALSGIEIPVLGVCLGHQALALADGKNVVRSKKGPVHGQPVKVEHDGSGIFAGQKSPMTLTRYNSLIVEGNTGILRESAWSDKEIMGLTHPNFEVHGIQIHPESVGSELGYSILDSFLSKARC